MKKLIRACLLAPVFAMPCLVWAGQCIMKPTGGVESSNPYVYNLPGFDPGAFDPNVPDGTVIDKRSLAVNTTTSGWYTCLPEIYRIVFRGTTAAIGKAPGNGTTYSTGISGVGMRFSLSGPNAIKGYWPVFQYYQPGIASAPIGTTPLNIDVELVKVGAITAGGAITGEVAGYFGHYGQIASIRVGGGIIIQPKVPTCRVTNPAITVPLGSMPASTFTGVGSVSPSKPFNIALQCSGGETGTVTNVYTTLTDHNNPGNVSDTLSLATDATATGIGIQVLNGSTVIKYGPDSSATGNTNQWKAGEAGNGTFTIPLTARYIQTASKVTPGTADGLATFTMSYQ
ncbi:fimbrial protein [Burkholderia stagnalis]|uniref:fimbrial protein n=1 Tax=Burkholderia stagnalis TaxID=1503054 RepID=UPI000A99522D|nr:fimbrial protein [Burkholderia stagnalis]